MTGVALGRENRSNPGFEEFSARSIRHGRLSGLRVTSGVDCATLDPSAEICDNSVRKLARRWHLKFGVAVADSPHQAALVRIPRDQVSAENAALGQSGLCIHGETALRAGKC